MQLPVFTGLNPIGVIAPDHSAVKPPSLSECQDPGACSGIDDGSPALPLNRFHRVACLHDVAVSVARADGILKILGSGLEGTGQPDHSAALVGQVQHQSVIGLRCNANFPGHRRLHKLQTEHGFGLGPVHGPKLADLVAERQERLC